MKDKMNEESYFRNNVINPVVDFLDREGKPTRLKLVDKIYSAEEIPPICVDRDFYNRLKREKYIIYENFNRF